MAELSNDLSGTVTSGESASAGRSRTTAELLQALLDSSQSLIFLKDTAYRYVFVNRAFAAVNNKTAAELIGKSDEAIMPPDTAAQIRADERKVLETRKAYVYEEEVRALARHGHYATTKLPVFDARGELIGLGGFIVDITERKRQEAEQQQMIAAQQDMLRELSTPLLPIADGVLAIPVVGAVDSTRARELLETLLRGICEHKAHTAILDVTGIRQIDGETARTLVDAAHAARLVGARVVLTGISPEVAQTLITLGVDLSGILTLATLASGIAFALRP